MSHLKVFPSTVNKHVRSSVFPHERHRVRCAGLTRVEVSTIGAMLVHFKFNKMLPKPKPLPDKQYSLMPDMALGWVPRMRLMSIKLAFTVMLNDDIRENENTIYAGFRPNDSIQLHCQYGLRDQKL